MNEVRKASLIIFLICAVIPTMGQVVNNSIHSRSELIPDSLFVSSTANNTVEWNCINKSLTQKCLVYHNDQWFHFTPQKSGKVYLNISSQACRDSRGVQMIVIEGNPCEIQTYRILKCIPKIYQDDVFIELDSLKAQTLYLINMDGYLGDFCRFEITLSDKPKGLPQQKTTLRELNLKTEDTEYGVRLSWQVSDRQLDETDNFEIYRYKSGDAKTVLLAKAGTRSNALGKHDKNYVHVDKIYQAGNYRYTILAVSKMANERTVLDESTISVEPDIECIAQIPLDFGKRSNLQISIMDPENNRTLHVFSYEYLQPQFLPVSLSGYAIRGIKRFWIKVRHEKSGVIRMFAFRLDDRNRLHTVKP